MPHKIKDYTGQFSPNGKIEFLYPVRVIRSQRSLIRWVCRCGFCGNEFKAPAFSVIQGDYQSCGCQRKFLIGKGNAKTTNAIGAARLKAGLTQKEVAASLGIAKNSLSKIELDIVKPRIHKVCGALRKIKTDGEKYLITDGATRADLRNIAIIPCGYCGKLLTLKKSRMNQRLRVSKTGKLFCNHSCGTKFQYHGVLPIPVAPEIVLMDAPKPPKERKPKEITRAIAEIVKEKPKG